MFLFTDSRAADSCVTDKMVKFVNKLSYNVNAIVERYEKIPDRKRYIAEIIEENLDADVVTRFLMGRFFESSTEGQRADFHTEVMKYIARRYSSYLVNGISGEITILKSNCYDSLQGIVMIRVTDSDNNFYTLQYKMGYRGNGVYKIGDVTFNGVSLLIATKEEFDKSLSEVSLDEHIAMMRQENLNSGA